MNVGSEFKRKVNLGYNYKGDTNPFEWITFSLMTLAVIYVLFILYRIMTITAFMVIAMAVIAYKIVKRKIGKLNARK